MMRYRLVNSYATDKPTVDAPGPCEAARLVADMRYGTRQVGSYYGTRDGRRVVVYEARRSGRCVGRFELEEVAR